MKDNETEKKTAGTGAEQRFVIRSSLHLKVNILGGTDISDACTDAVILSRHLNLTIDFNFNDVHVMVFPYSTPSKIVESYYEQLKSDDDYKIACSHV